MKLLVTLCVFVCAVASASQQPGITLCLTDDQGWGDVNCHGLTKIKPPLTPVPAPQVDKAAVNGFKSITAAPDKSAPILLWAAGKTTSPTP